MSKIIIDRFSGISSIRRGTDTDKIDEASRDIMPQRERGYLMPGYSETVNNTDAVLKDVIVDAVTDPNADGRIWAIDSQRLYSLTGNGTVFSDTTHAIPGTGGKGVQFYHIGTNNNLFYLIDTTMGMVNSTGTYDDDWLSTRPANASSPAFASAGYRPKLIWKTYLWIGDGRYVNKLDGQTGANGTYTRQALDLGIEWQITSMFPTQNYIGICARRRGNVTTNPTDANASESRVFFWDGTSSVHNYSTPVKASNIVSSCNVNGVIYLVTIRNGLYNLDRLTDNGIEHIRKFNFDNYGSRKYYFFNNNCLAEYNSYLLIGGYSTSWNGQVFSYGSETPEVENSFNKVFSNESSWTTNLGYTGVLGSQNKVYVSYSEHIGSEDRYHWSVFDSTGYTGSYYTPNYIDLGQKCVINYIELFFKPLVSGDSISVKFEKNYETTQITPQTNAGVISYALDGAATSKRFDMGQVECHAFRPAITWSSGGVAISKIVIDYAFIEN